MYRTFSYSLRLSACKLLTSDRSSEIILNCLRSSYVWVCHQYPCFVKARVYTNLFKFGIALSESVPLTGNDRQYRCVCRRGKRNGARSCLRVSLANIETGKDIGRRIDGSISSATVTVRLVTIHLEKIVFEPFVELSLFLQFGLSLCKLCLSG